MSTKTCVVSESEGVPVQLNPLKHWSGNFVLLVLLLTSWIVFFKTKPLSVAQLPVPNQDTQQICLAFIQANLHPTRKLQSPSTRFRTVAFYFAFNVLYHQEDRLSFDSILLHTKLQTQTETIIVQRSARSTDPQQGLCCQLQKEYAHLYYLISLTKKNIRPGI